MLSFPQFLLESSICLLVFYLFYYWVLRKETFFQLNRLYLLASPLLAILIPVLNIQLQQPTVAPSNSLETYLYPAVSSAQSFNELIWQQIDAPTPAFSLTIGDLLLIAYLLGMLYMLIRLTNSMLALFQLIAKSQKHKSQGYTIVETAHEFPAASFFSYVFWNGKNMTEEQKLIFEHELVHIRQKHSLDVLLMEFWVIIKWYNPLIYLYRNALQVTHEYIADNYVSRQAKSVYQYANLLVQQAQVQPCHKLLNTFSALVKKRLVMLGKHQSAWYKSLKYLLSIPVFVGMMLLFSFNLVEEIPSNPISATLINLENYLEDFGEKTVLEIDKEHPYAEYLEWGGVEFPLVQKDASDKLKLDVRSLTPAAFEQIQFHSFNIRQLYEEEAIISFEIIGQFADGNTFHCENDLPCFYQNMAQNGTESTLLLKLRNTNQQVFYTLISVSNTNRYQPLSIQDDYNFFEGQLTSIEYFCTQGPVLAEDLRLQGKNQYYLEWGTRKFQAIKSGNPLKEPFDIQSLSLPEFEDLQVNNFSMVYNNSCLLIDSVYTTVTNQNGRQLHCKDQWKDDACYRSFLHDVEDNSTVYLVIKTKLGDIFSSIISIGEEATLYFENEDFYSEMLRYTHFPINEQNMQFAPPTHYELFWGDIQVDLKKSTLDDSFEGRYELSKTDFLKAVKKEPILGLAQGHLFDNLTFDFLVKNTENTYTKYGKINVSASDNALYQENKLVKTIDKLVENAQSISLQNIRYNDRTSDEINLYIHFKAEPQLITQKRKRLNWYQFHWGDIDAKIMEYEEGKFDVAQARVSIEDFEKSLDFEPVLTSQEDGVLFDFELDVQYQKNRFGIKSKANQPSVYTDSFDKKALLKNLAVDDTIIIHGVQTASFEDDFRFEIHITEPTVENIKRAKYKDKIILDWGNYEFPLRQLNADQKDASQIPIISLQPAFFKSILCNEMTLYHKGMPLKIMEAAVLVKESDYQESCKIEDWTNRDAMHHLLEHACEESQINLFLKTASKKNYLLRFQLSQGLENEEIGFGRDTTQVFNELIEDYSTKVWERKVPKPMSNEEMATLRDKAIKNMIKQGTFDDTLIDKDIEIIWGERSFYLETKNNYIGGHRTSPFLSFQSFESFMDGNIQVLVDGTPYIITAAELNNTSSRYKHKDRTINRFYLNCENDNCHIPIESIDKVLKEIHEEETVTLFIKGHAKDSTKEIPLGSIYFHFNASTTDWNPAIKPQKLKTIGETFPFQMINQNNRPTVVRMDTTNQKYAWMVDSYQNNPSVDLIHIDDFQSYQRVLDDKQLITQKENIKQVEILTKNSVNPFVYPDFYAFEQKHIALHWKGFRASSWEPDFYCLEDFKKAKGPLTFSIDGQTIPVLQFEAYLIAEDGTTTKFISDRVDKKEIEKAINVANERTTIAFEELLIETPEGRMRMPMRFLFYLE